MNSPFDELGGVAESSSVPNFCTRCGTPWEAGWKECAVCAVRTAPASAGIDIKREKSSLLQSLGLYGALLLVSIITIIVVLASGEDMGFNGEVAATICFNLIVVLFALFGRSGYSTALLKTGDARWYLAALMLSVATFVMAMLAVKALHHFAGAEEILIMPTIQQAGYGVGMAILLVAVSPAVFEEIAFRGVIFSSMGKLLSAGETIFVTAGMFAILHLSVVSMPHLFVMGLVLGWLRHKTGSLYPGMLLHFMHNTFCILIEVAEKGG